MKKGLPNWILACSVASGLVVCGVKASPPTAIEADATATTVKMAAYLGVQTQPVAPETGLQLGLAPGFGLLVKEVLVESPADLAGVQKHDVLVLFKDQILVNTEQLEALVRCGRKGDEVPLTLFSKGERRVASVVLDEAPLETPIDADPEAGPRLAELRERWDANFKTWQAQSDQLKQEWQAFREKMQAWIESGRQGAAPQPPLDGHSPGLVRSETIVSTGTYSEGRVTRRDDSGEYELRTVAGRTTFSAKPKEGNEGSWLVDEEAQRKAVPEVHQEKLAGLLKVREQTLASGQVSR